MNEDKGVEPAGFWGRTASRLAKKLSKSQERVKELEAEVKHLK